MMLSIAQWSKALALRGQQPPRRAFSLAAPGQPPYRVLFFGTDDISLATLRRLHANSLAEGDARLVEHIEVVCPSDRKVGRSGARNEPVPAKKFAQRHGLPVVHTPPHLCVSLRIICS